MEITEIIEKDKIDEFVQKLDELPSKSERTIVMIKLYEEDPDLYKEVFNKIDYWSW